MILPPYLDRPIATNPEGHHGEVLDHAYGDVRVPTGYGYGEDKNGAHPLADQLGGRHVDGRPRCDHRGRWDVIVAEAGERWDAEDNELPREFRLRATCSACGLVYGLEGELTPSTHRHGGPYYLGDGADDELRAKDVLGRELIAQRHSAHAGVAARWTVYRRRGDGRGWYAVGSLSAGQTVRGRDYVVARYGHPNESRHPNTVLVEAPTPAGALRKLAKLDPPTTVGVARYVPGTRADDYRGTFVTDLVPDPTTAEAAADRAADLERRNAQRAAEASYAPNLRAAHLRSLEPGRRP